MTTHSTQPQTIEELVFAIDTLGFDQFETQVLAVATVMPDRQMAGIVVDMDAISPVRQRAFGKGLRGVDLTAQIPTIEFRMESAEALAV